MTHESPEPLCLNLSSEPHGPWLLLETTHTLGLMTSAIAFRCGATFDPPEREGLCSLMARLMRRTGGGLDPVALDARLDRLGSSLGVDVSHSSVVFQGSVLSRSFEGFVDLLAEVLGRPGMSEEELERLKRETESELVDVLDNDQALVRRWFQRRLFHGHPYGRSVHGTIEHVRAARPDEVTDLYRKMIVSGSVVFGLAGDVDRSAAERAALRLLQAIAPGPDPQDATPEPSGVSGRHLVVVDKPERTQTQILIGGLGTHPRDPDHFALLVANTVLGGAFSARMTQAIRCQRGWSYGACSTLGLDRQRHAFSMWTFPKAEDAASCIRLELELLEQWVSCGISQQELEWAQRYLVRSHAFAIETPARRVNLALEEQLLGLPAGYYRHYRDSILGVTQAQANEAIARRISPHNLIVTVLGTESEIGTELQDAIPDLKGYEVIAFDQDG